MKEIIAMYAFDSHPSDWSALLAVTALKGTLLLVLAFAAATLLRRFSAAARGLLWTASFLALLALPALVLLGPSWNWEILPSTQSHAATTPARPPIQAASVRQAGRSGTAEATALPVAERPDDFSSQGSSMPTTLTSGNWVAGLWVLGLSIVLLRWWIGMILLAKRTRMARVASGHLQATCVQLSRRLGLAQQVRLLLGDEGGMPMTWGVFKPVILLPQEAGEWSAKALQSVLLHELAHVRRRDLFVQHLATLACALHWFNPLVWMAARRLRQERERACDDLVLAGGARPSDYAEQLLSLAHIGRLPRGGTAALAMARPNQLEGRLTAILDAARRRGDLSRGRLVIALGLVLAFTLPLAGLGLAQRSQAGRIDGHLSHSGARTMEIDLKGVHLEGQRLVRIEQGGVFDVTQSGQPGMRLAIRPESGGGMIRAFTLGGVSADPFSNQAEELLNRAITFVQGGLIEEPSQMEQERLSQEQEQEQEQGQKQERLRQEAQEGQAVEQARQEAAEKVRREERQAEQENRRSAEERRSAQEEQEARHRRQQVQNELAMALNKVMESNRGQLRQLKRRLLEVSTEALQLRQGHFAELVESARRVLAQSRFGGAGERESAQVLEKLQSRLGLVLRQDQAQLRRSLEEARLALEEVQETSGHRLLEAQQRVREMMMNVEANVAEVARVDADLERASEALARDHRQRLVEVERALKETTETVERQVQEAFRRTEANLEAVRENLRRTQEGRDALGQELGKALVAALDQAGIQLSSLQRSQMRLELDEFIGVLLREGTLRVVEEPMRFHAAPGRLFDRINVFLRELLGTEDWSQEKDRELDRLLQGVAKRFADFEVPQQ